MGLRYHSSELLWRRQASIYLYFCIIYVSPYLLCFLIASYSSNVSEEIIELSITY